MGKNTSVVLGQHFTQFVDQQIDAGRYGSASEVIRAGLRLLEDHETQTLMLRRALEEGENSGTGQPFDIDAFIASKKG